MHILVTRPETDAGDLKTKLESRGHRVSLAPLMNIELLPIPQNVLDGASAIVATSRNGLRSLAASETYTRAQGLPLFVVGRASAALAAEFGFKDVVTGHGSAADLAPEVLSFAKKQNGPIVLITGDETAFDMAAYLTASGIAERSVLAYRAAPAKSLPEPAVQDLASGSIDSVVLMSARTARIWLALTTAAGLQPMLASQIRHVCFSEAVANVVRDHFQGLEKTHAIETVIRPETEEILALIDRLAAQSGS